MGINGCLIVETVNCNDAGCSKVWRCDIDMQDPLWGLGEEFTVISDATIHLFLKGVSRRETVGE